MKNSNPLIIDTDPGVDDALALAWLLTQSVFPVDVLGIGVIAFGVGLFLIAVIGVVYYRKT